MTKKLDISGMSCEHCVHHVTEALEGVAGVESAKVDLKGRSATVTGSALDDTLMREAVADAGYEVVSIS
jgi:copper chaperone CopZ